MKKRIISVLLVLVLALSLISCGSAEQIENIAEPVPLIIETKDRATISNPVPGTVKIITPYQDTKEWAGLLYIQLDGGNAEVFLIDAVECFSEDGL